MEHKFSIDKFPPGKWGYLFRDSVYSGKFPVERNQKVVFQLHPNRNIRNFFGKWKTLIMLGAEAVVL